MHFSSQPSSPVLCVELVAESETPRILNASMRLSEALSRYFLGEWLDNLGHKIAFCQHSVPAVLCELPRHLSWSVVEISVVLYVEMRIMQKLKQLNIQLVTTPVQLRSWAFVC